MQATDGTTTGGEAAEPTPADAAHIQDIVVGVDGSEESVDAVAWALREAERRDVSVRAVLAWRPSSNAAEIYQRATFGSTRQLEDMLLSNVQHTVTEAVDRTGLSDVAISTRFAHGHPVQELTDAAGAVSLLVVGSRGRGALTGTVMGSTSQGCVQYARGPVVVVRGSERNQDVGAAVVVGVDGSRSSIAAERFAAHAATVRSGVLYVVHGWLYNAADLAESVWPRAHPVLAGEAETVLADSVSRIAADFPGLDVRPHLVRTLDHTYLLDAAVGASLLVVGSRGHGGFPGMLLGSVSLRCITQATCPVAVIHSPAAAHHDNAPHPTRA